jgi:Protein of unknown function (DUF1553)/Protein of unknown function (DUF1549)
MHTRLAVLALSAATALTAAESIFETTAPAPTSKIDQLVFAHLKQLQIEPAALSSDSVFLRRVFLDTVGILPTPEEAREFLADTNPAKRSALIDRLLARPEFADYWANKWCDLLRVKAEFPINLWPNAAQAYHHWIRASIAANKPYDQFVRQLLTESGSNFRNAPVNFYRAMQNRTPQGIAQSAALTFMGTRAEKWPAAQLAGMAAFFSRVGFKETGEWKEEIVFFDPAKPAAAQAQLPDGTEIKLAPDQDPREAFASWLTSPKNPWFARAIVNRAWYWVLGRGIIQEPDDIRADNPPENPELLAYLEHELLASNYDLKQIYRLILNSQVYQLSPVPRSDRPDAAAHFAYYPLRRLDAETLIDAINQITGTGETYSSAIPEPYTFMPDDQRATALPDGSITSAFLELFGRPPRDTGIEAERNNRLTDAQRLHLLNSSHILNKLQQGPKLRNLARTPRALYLAILSRYPTDDEMKLIARMQPVDIAWALINSTEFLYRH